jgi:Icc protein
MLFMHHPPLYCGVPHMDEKYAFRQIPLVQQYLRGLPFALHIFCGHYHVERDLRVANQHVYITPSTFFQIDAAIVEFGIDHSMPGYRIIELEENGSLHTYCLYVRQD